MGAANTFRGKDETMAKILAKEYFMKLIPDLAAFDRAEKMYYDLGALSNDNIKVINSSGTISWNRFIVRYPVEKTLTITPPNYDYVDYRFSVGDYSYAVIIDDTKKSGSNFSLEIGSDVAIVLRLGERGKLPATTTIENVNIGSVLKKQQTKDIAPITDKTYYVKTDVGYTVADVDSIFETGKTYYEDSPYINKKISEIWSESRYNFDDHNKYVYNIPATLLEEFEEYKPDYITFATNTGYMCFLDKTNKKLYIYDILKISKVTDSDRGKTTISTMSSITPDYRYLSYYTSINSPLSVRRLHFENGVIQPDQTINVETTDTDGKKYIIERVAIDCDYIYYKETGTENEKNKSLKDSDIPGFFELNSNENITNLGFNYKPMFIVRVLSGDSNNFTFNDVSCSSSSVNPSPVYSVYYCDLSASNNTTGMVSFTAEGFTGTLEVI